MPEKIAAMQSGYSIKTHGGIGDELWEPSDRGERQKCNLSGSCHELKVHINGQVLKILVDVWGYQGRWKLERNIQAISAWVSAIILTHPHMDHIGDFPRAFTEWSEFDGRVFCTPGTLQASEIALIDAAKILQRDYEKRKLGWEKTMEEIAGAFYTIRKNDATGVKRVPKASNGNRVAQTGDVVDRETERADAMAILEKYGLTLDTAKNWRKNMIKNEPEKPAYTIEDVYESLSSIETHTIKDGWKELVPGQVAFRFYNAGHIVGSVSVVFRITHQKKSKYVLFSWDLGSYKWDMHPTGIANPPHNLPIDTVNIEATYWDRERKDFEKWFTDFKENLIEDLEKYRRITIATFAMDRTQNILARLIKMKLAWEIDADIILDSPAGTKHTQAYIQAVKDIEALLAIPNSQEVRRLLGRDFEERERKLLMEFAEFINPANGHYQIANEDNRGEIFAETGKKKIVLTASGMADGWMVLEHLEKNIEDPTTVFYFPGYLVAGTLGHALANTSQPGGQQKRVTIEWKKGKKIFEVKAEMKQFNFLSGHWDVVDLLAWLWVLKLQKGSTVRIVHGDINGSSLAFKHRLEAQDGFADKNIIVPWLEEEHFFPFDEVDPKKSWPRKTTRWPLVVQPGPERKKILPKKSLEKPKKRPKKQKSVLPPRQKKTNAEKWKAWIKRAIKVWSKVFAERNRYTELIASSQKAYNDFYHSLRSITIPFLEPIKQYYWHLEVCDNLESYIDSQWEYLATNNRRLFDAQKLVKDDARKKSWINIDQIQEEITNIETNIARSTHELESYRANMESNPIKEKISANMLSKWIIESLGYTTDQIEIHPELTLLDGESGVTQVLRDVCIKVLEYDSTNIENGYQVFTDVANIRNIKQDSSWDYSIEDKELLAKLDGINIWSVLDTSIIYLMGKINPNYSIDIKPKKIPVPRKKIQTVQSITPIEKAKTIEVDSWIQDNTALEIRNLEEQRKTYRVYYEERLSVLEKDKNRLVQLKWVRESWDKPSRGKYLNLSTEELELEIITKTQEISKTERILKSKKLMDNTDKYDDIMIALKKISRKRF